MTAGVTKHLLDSHLAQALRDCGLKAASIGEMANDANVIADISVQLGRDTGALATMSCAEPDSYKCLDQTIDRLLKHKDVKFAVAVCYAGGLASNSVEEARYVWQMKPRSGAKSGLMSGGIADLALTISLVFGTPREPGPVARWLAEFLAEDDPDALTVALPRLTATGDSRIDVRQRLQRGTVAVIVGRVC